MDGRFQNLVLKIQLKVEATILEKRNCEWSVRTALGIRNAGMEGELNYFWAT